MEELNVVDWALATSFCLRGAADEMKHERRTPGTNKSSPDSVNAKALEKRAPDDPLPRMVGGV